MELICPQISIQAWNYLRTRTGLAPWVLSFDMNWPRYWASQAWSKLWAFCPDDSVSYFRRITPLKKSTKISVLCKLCLRYCWSSLTLVSPWLCHHCPWLACPLLRCARDEVPLQKRVNCFADWPNLRNQSEPAKTGPHRLHNLHSHRSQAMQSLNIGCLDGTVIKLDTASQSRIT